MKEDRTFEGWVWTFLGAIDDLHDKDYYTILGATTEGADKITVYGFGKDERDERIIFVADQLLATHPECVFWATTTLRKDIGVEESKRAYVVAGVTNDGMGLTCFLTRLHDQSDEWTSLEKEEVPWFAISSALSLIDSMKTGTPIALREAAHPILSTTPRETSFTELSQTISMQVNKPEQN